MSNFANLKKIKIQKKALFGKVGLNTMNLFETASGKLVGFRLVDLSSEKEKYYASEIYDLKDGERLVGSVSVDAGVDYTGGLFESGCVSDKQPFDESANFYIVDY